MTPISIGIIALVAIVAALIGAALFDAFCPGPRAKKGPRDSDTCDSGTRDSASALPCMRSLLDQERLASCNRTHNAARPAPSMLQGGWTLTDVRVSSAGAVGPKGYTG